LKLSNENSYWLNKQRVDRRGHSNTKGRCPQDSNTNDYHMNLKM